MNRLLQQRERLSYAATRNADIYREHMLRVQELMEELVGQALFPDDARARLEEIFMEGLECLEDPRYWLEY